jgi:hypothetical protein
MPVRVAQINKTLARKLSRVSDEKLATLALKASIRRESVKDRRQREAAQVIFNAVMDELLHRAADNGGLEMMLRE